MWILRPGVLVLFRRPHEFASDSPTHMRAFNSQANIRLLTKRTVPWLFPIESSPRLRLYYRNRATLNHRICLVSAPGDLLFERFIIHMVLNRRIGVVRAPGVYAIRAIVIRAIVYRRL